jgi:hypothetical protein
VVNFAAMRSGLLISLFILFCLGCHSKPAESPCGGVEGGVTTGARTGAEGARTGVETGVAGAKQFGNSAAGLVQGGSDEAKARWNDGKQKTKETANRGSERTSDEAHRCSK